LGTQHLIKILQGVYTEIFRHFIPQNDNVTDRNMRLPHPDTQNRDSQWLRNPWKTFSPAGFNRVIYTMVKNTTV